MGVPQILLYVMNYKLFFIRHNQLVMCQINGISKTDLMKINRPILYSLFGYPCVKIRAKMIIIYASFVKSSSIKWDSFELQIR